jgi:hypothetical protein
LFEFSSFLVNISQQQFRLTFDVNCIGGVKADMFSLNVVDCGFNTRFRQTEDYNIDTCCFSDMHAAARTKNKDWLTRNRDNVSEWSGLLSVLV